MEKLKELLNYILKEMVEDQKNIEVNAVEKETNIVLNVKISNGELGKVIGKNGLTASAIRGVMQAAGVKDGLNVNVEFLD